MAIAITSRRAEGGKAPRPTWARRILQATEALRQIAMRQRPTVWRLQCSSLATCRFDGRSGAAARRIT